VAFFATLHLLGILQIHS